MADVQGLFLPVVLEPNIQLLGWSRLSCSLVSTNALLARDLSEPDWPGVVSGMYRYFVHLQPLSTDLLMRSALCSRVVLHWECDTDPDTLPPYVPECGRMLICVVVLQRATSVLQQPRVASIILAPGFGQPIFVHFFDGLFSTVGLSRHSRD